MVLWKETAFPLCRATEKLWKRNVNCLPGVFRDSGDTPANLLCELNGHLMPCTSCLYGKWVEDVCTGQFGVFVYLVLCCIIIIIMCTVSVWSAVAAHNNGVASYQDRPTFRRPRGSLFQQSPADCRHRSGKCVDSSLLGFSSWFSSSIGFICSYDVDELFFFGLRLTV